MAKGQEVTYTIGSRLLTTGDVAVVLQLYQDGKHTLTTTLMTCDRQELSGHLRTCRVHLERRSVLENARLPLVASL